MRKNFLFGLVVSVLLLLASQTAFAQTIVLSGRAYESSNPSQGVSNVKVYATPGGGPLCAGWSGGLVAVTSSFGYYAFEAPMYCSFFLEVDKKGRSFVPQNRFISGGIGPYDDVDWAAQ
jgi:hypothetical protein